MGRNHLQNDWLLRHEARSEDWWFHTHQLPGSHVLLKTEKRPVPNHVIEAAGQLAAFFSTGRESVNVPVIYTQIK